MSILVKILSVNNNTVTYSEISRKDGSTMITDSMSIEQFNQALKSVDYGFELVEIKNKQQVIKLLSMLNIEVVSWEYCRSVGNFVITLQLPFTYDNGWGVMINDYGVGGWSYKQLVNSAIRVLAGDAD